VTNGQKTLTTILIIVIGVLAIGSGFLFGENNNLKKQVSSGAANQTLDVSDKTVTNPIEVKTPTVSTGTETNAIKTDTSTKTTTTPSVTTTSSTVKPTAGMAGTYTVKSGDTLFSIALELDVNWLDLAKANGLDEKTANKIKIGQVLTVPKQ